MKIEEMIAAWALDLAEKEMLAVLRERFAAGLPIFA